MTIQEQKRIMVEYLKLMLFLEDWHGVRDAAADLERFEEKWKDQQTDYAKEILNLKKQSEKEKEQIRREVENEKYRWAKPPVYYTPEPKQFQTVAGLRPEVGGWIHK